jgi:hypothetical protein
MIRKIDKTYPLSGLFNRTKVQARRLGDSSVSVVAMACLGLKWKCSREVTLGTVTFNCQTRPVRSKAGRGQDLYCKAGAASAAGSARRVAKKGFIVTGSLVDERRRRGNVRVEVRLKTVSTW